MREAPSFKVLLKAFLLAATVSLLAFGLAHMALITWVVDRSGDSSLLARLAQMFIAPIALGLVPAAIACLIAAAVWRRTWDTPLSTWRWGIVAASGLLPALAANLVLGPSGDAPDPRAIGLILAGGLLFPAAIGAAFARRPAGLLAGLAIIPIGFWLSMFVQGEPLRGWTLPFTVIMFAIVASSGWLVLRFLPQTPPTPSQPFSDGPHSTEP